MIIRPNADKTSIVKNTANKIITGSTIANMAVCLTVTLMAIGAVFVFSASARIDTDYDLRKLYSYPEVRQAMFFIASIFVTVIVSFIDYHKLSFGKGRMSDWLKNPSFYLVFASILMLIAVLIPGIGIEVNNARRWLRVGAGPIMLNFQPSELAKWSLILFLPGVTVMLGENLKSFFKGFIPLMSLVGVVTLLILKEDFGTALFVAILSVSILSNLNSTR